MNKKDNVQTLGPARPEKLSVDFIETPKSITIVKNKGAGGGGCFLLLWLTGWTVGCVALIGVVINEPTIWSFAFALPFWASWFAVASYLIWLWYGKELFQAHHEGVSFERHAWIRLSAREVPVKEMLSFQECKSHHTENDRYLYGIELKTMGKPLRILFDLPDYDRRWLVHKLNGFYRLDRDTSSNDVVATTESQATRTISQGKNEVSENGSAQMLSFENTLAHPPTSCRWTMSHHFNSLSFKRRGKISWGAFFGLLFINLFWNGIVSVFVLALFGIGADVNGIPQGWGWIGMFVFLIPFVVIGMLMMFAFATNLLEPFHTTSWTFDPFRVQRKSCWLFLNFDKNWDVSRLERMELRAIDHEEQTKKFNPASSFSPSTEFGLTLVNKENQDCCTIDGLTRGEALWVAHQVMKTRSDWFH